MSKKFIIKKSINILLCVVCLFLTACDESGTDKAKGEKYSFFSNLDNIVLYINPPAWHEQEALRCHGIENKCADEYQARIPEYLRASRLTRDEHINKLKQDFLDYPIFFRSESLSTIFSNSINKYYNREKIPIITPLHTEIKDYLNRKNTLFVTVDHHTQSQTTPKMTVLQFSFYRPDLAHKYFPINRAVVFPNDMSSKDTAELISSHIGGLKTLNWPRSH